MAPTCSDENFKSQWLRFTPAESGHLNHCWYRLLQSGLQRSRIQDVVKGTRFAGTNTHDGKWQGHWEGHRTGKQVYSIGKIGRHHLALPCTPGKIQEGHQQTWANSFFKELISPNSYALEFLTVHKWLGASFHANTNKDVREQVKNL